MDIQKPMMPDDPDDQGQGGMTVQLPDGMDGGDDQDEQDQEGQMSDQESMNNNFKANLAELLDDDDLKEIANELIQGFDDDESSRSEWLQQYVDGLDYLGFESEDRTRPFDGACGVYHPVMTEAVVRFQSNAIMEIFPAAGPVLCKVIGDDTDSQKIQQAMRIKEELNYQLTENMCEFRGEMEQALFRLPLAGSVFKKTYYDPITQKPCSYMVTAEDFVVDYNSSNIDYAERCTHIMRMSKNKLLKMMRAKLYRKVDLQTPVPYTQDGREKEDELSGKEKMGTNPKDERYVVLEFHVHYNLPGPFEDEDGIADPYIITIDKSSREVLGIYRNWKEEDQARKPDCYFTHYFYMPGLGFYGIGLIHLMGAIAKGATSILRQLIDAGTLSNLPGGLKTRGMRTKGGEDPIAPGEWRDVDVPSGTIKDNILPLPYKEPSAVLAALLQNLIDEGRRIGSIADMDIGSGGENQPVGTTMALMERSLKVMSAVHARMHASLKRELKLIHDVIGDYMGPHYDWDLQGQFNRQQDFDARVDVIPVSDPNAATQAQRIVQFQAVMQLAQQAPELYNLKELHREGLMTIGIKNTERILPMDQDPPLMDPVQENMAILTGQPTKVYPMQDHQAHITAHMSFLQDPSIAEMVGQSPNAMKVQSAMESHIADHLANQYRQDIQQTMGVELPPMGQPLPPEIENRVSRLVAQAAVRVRNQHQAQAQAAQAQQIAQDPVFQLRQEEVAIKRETLEHQKNKDAAVVNLDLAKQMEKADMDRQRLKSEEVRAGAKIGADLVTFGGKLSADQQQAAFKYGTEAISEIQSAGKEHLKMAHEALKQNRQQAHERQQQQRQQAHERMQNELERQNKLSVAKSKKPTTPSS